MHYYLTIHLLTSCFRAMSRDSDVYPYADSFLPERWLSPAYPTTYREPLTSYPTIINHHQFGFGRRLCQGMDLVHAETITACGAIAWAYNLKKKTGDPSVPKEKGYTSLLITKPEAFDFELEFRSEKRGMLVRRLWEEAKNEDPQLVSRYDGIPVEERAVTID